MVIDYALVASHIFGIKHKCELAHVVKPKKLVSTTAESCQETISEAWSRPSISSVEPSLTASSVLTTLGVRANFWLALYQNAPEHY